MSGICGAVDLTWQGHAESVLVRQMTEMLRHRGPDSDGYYESPNVSLGARRLSVIDARGSDQPLYNEDRTIVLIFDGEIYNYRELRDQLKRQNHILNSGGDGETIIHLYEEYGLNLFSHLRGMYAFALWDNENERLVLAVDHAGMKPLYLSEQDGQLRFASEIKALLVAPDAPRRTNLDVLDAYLSFGYVPDEDTLFEGIRRLPPGHVCVVERGKPLSPQPFWELPRRNPDAQPKPDVMVISEIRDLLAEAVRIHLRSDAPVGLFLNGSIPSAALLGLMAHETSGQIRIYSADYGIAAPDGEHAQTRRLAEHFKAEYHEVVVTAEDWWRGFIASIEAQDEPIANPRAVPLFLLAQDAAQQVKVALSDSGGDAAFGGYPAHHTIPHLLAQRQGQYRNSAPIQQHLEDETAPAHVSRIRADRLSSAEASVRLQAVYNAVFNDALRGNLYKSEWLEKTRYTWDRFRNTIERSWRHDPYDTAQALVIQSGLAGNGSLHNDRITMAASLEARTPFLDPVLLKLAVQVPPALRMREHHYVLRQAARPFLPDFAVQQPPQVSRTPLRRWFDNELSGHIREVLLNPNAYITDFFNRAPLERLLKDHFWGRIKQHDLIFRLLVLELWGQQFIKPVRFSREPSATVQRQKDIS